ncbi:MAG: 16S rRNA (guanine(527)-N(7))-methyltransferase RsmG, partial [Clostridia bacterium]|nr:16S rRNA (guanine(527)-N(7))-methyltransferase RsmG [Clostridia bacterium]
MGVIADIVLDLCQKDGIELDAAAGDRLEKYAEMLIEKNKVMNLTAITQPEEVALKHFYDSLIPLKQIDIPKGAKVIDVGTGAGFPGMVLKIARPDIELTLLDSLNKRLVFLQEVLDE